ncbi:MAG: glycosyltransferase family 39 protein [Chitinophagales bacterium]|nr:glycosyltransferase family 39 protein [Chitinophagales bacterium]
MSFMLHRVPHYRTDRWLPILFFSALLIVGLAIHRDYGLSWDDPTQRRLGLVTYDYIFGKSTDLFANENCYINPFVALLEALPEKVLQPDNERDAYSMHHLANFIFCWVGLIFFYHLALQLFHDYRFAIIACIMFVLTPRLFAQCFYNSKDMTFLFLFVMSVYFTVVWLKRPSWSKMIGILIFSGILTATRIAGVIFPIILFIGMTIGVFSNQLKRKEIWMIAIFLLLYPVAVYIFFPTLWHDSLSKFIKTLALYSHHPYDVTTFFMGETIHSLKTPWYYIPVWMAIIIPLGWWIFFSLV